MPALHLDESKCIDCRICQLVCSARHSGLYRPALARIVKGSGILPDSTFTRVCRQCSDAPCAAECPAEALTADSASGIIALDEGKCTGCGLCIEVCPFGAIWLNDTTDRAYKCDLCGGKPECLERCPVEAISLG